MAPKPPEDDPEPVFDPEEYTNLRNSDYARFKRTKTDVNRGKIPNLPISFAFEREMRELKRRTEDGENPYTVARELGYGDDKQAEVIRRLIGHSRFVDDPVILAFLQSHAKVTALELKEDAFRWLKACLTMPNIPDILRQRAAETVLKSLQKWNVPLEDAAAIEDAAADTSAIARKYLKEMREKTTDAEVVEIGHVPEPPDEDE